FARGCAKGSAQPTAKDTSSPASSMTAKALRVVFSTLLLPCTVVIPTSCNCRAANRMATASSWPGSQSMRILLLLTCQAYGGEKHFYRRASAPPSSNSLPGLIAPAPRRRRGARSRQGRHQLGTTQAGFPHLASTLQRGVSHGIPRTLDSPRRP